MECASDAVLAAQLQAQEEQAAALAAAVHLRGGGRGQERLRHAAEDAAGKARGYEQELAQAMALSVMPADRLQAAAAEACALSGAMAEEPPLAPEDALAQELLLWFKREFFAWVDAPPCHLCGGSSRGEGAGTPTAEEAASGAVRVELYRCTACRTALRFPRYNDPVKLLETRRGRCGEWANCFCLCCRALGLDVRLAVDLTDHIWVEHWSGAQQKWVHLDPCEALADRPLLYEAGWGKQLTYVLAVGRDGAADVTRRYTKQWEQVRGRRLLAPERWLAGCLADLTGRLRRGLSPQQRRRLEERDALDEAHMAGGRATPLTEAELALPARQTGDAAWLAARGEDGRAAAEVQRPEGAGGGGGAAVGAGTRWRWARDEGLAGAHPRRLVGGAVRASGENAPAETAERAFDGSLHTKWLDFGGRQPGSAWLEYALPAGVPAVALASYALTSADDSPERDPQHVVLEGWAEEQGKWEQLDEQRALTFPLRHQRTELRVDPSIALQRPARRFRLRVLRVADPGAANSVQLACLDLYAGPAADTAATSRDAPAAVAAAKAGEAAADDETAAAAGKAAGQVEEPAAAAAVQAGAAMGEQGGEAEAGDQTASTGLAAMTAALEHAAVAPPRSLPPAAASQPPSLAERQANPWAALFGAAKPGSTS